MYLIDFDFNLSQNAQKVSLSFFNETNNDYIKPDVDQDH
ncbi:protein of unknown function [Candidatus Nitrosocosmicus franklandus]|uniref:Uncharacterized protein n=1 Tax=Candidatus Nitrosocosmicus franklandianus TaxID=1798806 RepID=A0A484IHP2_9ARCH|nr:protein of unknown function [Candidatus Nitrosocosmicus franklandus]